MRVLNLNYGVKKTFIFLALIFLAFGAFANSGETTGTSTNVLALFKSSELDQVSQSSPLLINYVLTAQRAYASGEFTKALIYLDKISERNNKMPLIKDKKEFCKTMIASQNRILLSYPSNDKDRNSLVKSKYKEAEKLFKENKLSEAKAIFTEIWMLKGEYKKTCKYIISIENKADASDSNNDNTKGSGENLKSQIILAQNTDEEKTAQIKESLDKASDLLTEKNYDAAKSEIEKILVIDPNNSKANKMLSKIDKAKEKEAQLKEKLAAAEKAEQEAAKAKEEELKAKEEAAKQKEAEEQARIDADAKAKEEAAKQKEAAEQAKQAELAKEQELKGKITEAEQLLKDGNYAEAIKKSEEILKDNPDNAKALKVTSKANAAIEKDKARQEKLAAAEKAEQEAAKAKEEELKAKEEAAKQKEAEEKARLEAEQKTKEEAAKAKEAAEQAKQAELAKEQELKGKIAEAEQLLKDGNYAEAIKKSEEILKDNPDNAKALKVSSKANAAIEKDKARQEKLAAEEKAKEEELKAKEEIAKQKEAEEKARLEAEQKTKEEAAKAKEEAAKKQADEAQQRAAQIAKEKELAAKAKEAEALIKEGKYEEAVAAAQKVLDEDAQNQKALSVIEKANAEKAKAEQARLEADAKAKEAEEKAKAEEAAKKAAEEKEVAQKAEEAKKASEDAELKKIQQQEEKKVAQAKEITEEGISLFNKQDYEGAIKKFDEALAIQPLYAKASEYKTEAQKQIDAKKTTEVAQTQPTSQNQQAIPFETTTQKQEETAPAPVSTEPTTELKPLAPPVDENKIKFDSAMKEAKDLFKAKKYDEAEFKAREALSIDPASKEAAELSAKSSQAKISDKTKGMFADAKQLEINKAYQAAIGKYNEILNIDPQNSEAKEGITRIQKKIEEDKNLAKLQAEKSSKDKADALFKQGLDAWNQKKVEDAHKYWNEALSVYPGHVEASRYIEQTKGDYQKVVNEKAKAKLETEKESSFAQKIKTPVTIQTRVPTRISKLLENFSIITGINFAVSEGVDANIEAKFDDKPLDQVLDALLLPIGLKWERKVGSDIVIVTPDLQTRVFTLNQEEMAKVKTLYDSQRLHKLLWGEEAIPKVKGVELHLDEREMVLISVDSKINQDKLDLFIKDLKVEAAPVLSVKSYNIKPDEAPKIKAYLEARLKFDSDAPYSKERKLIIDSNGEVLFVKDTPDNIKIVEEFLKDRNLLTQLDQGKLEISTFSLVPSNVLEMDFQTKSDFMMKIQDVVDTFLYSKEGKSAAAEKGRRMWVDPDAMQLTITDYPENIRAVGQFIESLPQIQKKEKTKIFVLKYASSSEMVSNLQSILGISTNAASPTASKKSGQSVEMNLSIREERDYQGLKIRLTRVNDNNIDDQYDDSAEFYIRTSTTSQDSTIEEFRSEFIEDFEIAALDIRPSGTAGEGTVRIEIRNTRQGTTTGGGGGAMGLEGGGLNQQPQGGLQQQQQQGTGTGTLQATQAAKPTYSIESFDAYNSVILRYENPADLAKVSELIEQFDMPKLQVSIETKFVEVIESKAKEFSSEFALSDITQGLDFDNSVMNMRYANDYDELKSQFEPAAEDIRSANLMKGTTVFSLLTGGANPLNYQLRLLEAEGIINVVNGPHIVTQNQSSATFTITRSYNTGLVDSSGNAVGTGFIQPIQNVNMTVSPTITQLGSIDLSITCNMLDFDNNMGQVVSVQKGSTSSINVGAIQNVFEMSRIQKNVTTNARIKDGGTIVLGGWTGERSGKYTSGLPVLRNVPFVGKLLFGRNMMSMDKTTLMIFLTGKLVD